MILPLESSRYASDTEAGLLLVGFPVHSCECVCVCVSLFVCEFVMGCLCVHPALHPQIHSSFYPSIHPSMGSSRSQSLQNCTSAISADVTLQVYNVSVDADAFLDIDGYSMETAEESCPPPLSPAVASKPQLERVACKLAFMLRFV